MTLKNFHDILENTESLIQSLEAAGFEAYYVGGCVRDVMLSQDSISDIDVTTSATPEEMKKVFADYKVKETGIKHGTLTVFAGNQPVEITTFRTEGEYSDSRHPDKVNFVRSLEEDLGRRDFTINAMALDIRGNIVDLYGGGEDLEARQIRAVGEPDLRFQEDALRIMRALRFAATLCSKGQAGTEDYFEIGKETEEAMFCNKELLKGISSERIYSELKKLIVGQYAGIVIRRYIDILGVILPELLELKGFAQHNPYHKYDVLEHCVRTLEMCHQSVPVAFAAVLHDVGKPKTYFQDEDGIGHMYGHPAEGEKIVKDIMLRLKVDRETMEHVCLLVKHHDLVFQKNERLLKRWMNKYTPEILLEILQLKRADNFSTGNMSEELCQKYDDVEKMIHNIIQAGDPFSLKDLDIDGNDLLAISKKHLSAGPWISHLLVTLLEEVVDDKIENKKEALIPRAKELMKTASKEK